MKDQVLTPLTYDANGNLTSDGVWTYTYDVENRLITATDGSTNVTYTYDPLGRRVKKSGVGVTTRLYLSDGTEEVVEYTSSGSVGARYIYGPGVDEPVMTWQGSSVSLGNMRFYRADPQGSIVALTDRDGVVEDTYTYDAYGNPDDPGGQPIRYTGRRWDAETGLYYYRARMYSPAIGRFLQTDPIGYGDNVNLYGYVRNDPVNATDPLGLETIKVECTTNQSRAAQAACNKALQDLANRINEKNQDEDQDQNGDDDAEDDDSNSNLNLNFINSRTELNIAIARLKKKSANIINLPDPNSGSLDELTVVTGFAFFFEGIANVGSTGFLRNFTQFTPSRIVIEFSPKIVRDMAARGWNPALVRNTILNPAFTRVARNKATGGSATAYYIDNTHYVVRDNFTGKIIQVSNRGNPNWVPDSTIINPPK